MPLWIPWQESPNLLSKYEVPVPNSWVSLEPVPSQSQAFARIAYYGYLRGSSDGLDILTGDQASPLDDNSLEV